MRAGVAFTITVTTVGFGCTAAEGGAVEIRGGPRPRSSRTIAMPEPGPRLRSAPRNVTVLPRDLQVTLPLAGTARLRVVGLRASTPESALDSVDITINVLP